MGSNTSKFTELIEAIQAAKMQENGATDFSLDEKSSHSLDLLDAYRLAHYDFVVVANGGDR